MKADAGSPPTITRFASTHWRRAAALALSGILAFDGSALARTRVTTIASSTTTGTIVGRVTSGGKPSEFANVFLVHVGRGTQTTKNGRFRLDHVPLGHRFVAVNQIGCVPETIFVAVATGRVSSLAIDLERPATPRPPVPPFLPNPEEHARLGMRCKVHRGVPLASDTVKLHYGFVGAGAVDPNSFPNARMTWDMGCVDAGYRFTEVAYCSECRRAYEQWVKRNGRRPGD